jgi:hypothetical protein
MLKEILKKEGVRFGLNIGSNRGCYKYLNENSDLIKTRKFTDQLSDCHIPKTNMLLDLVHNLICDLINLLSI